MWKSAFFLHLCEVCNAEVVVSSQECIQEE